MSFRLVVMGFLMFLIKAFAVYGGFGVFARILFHSEIEIRKRLAIFNSFSNTRTKYYYLHTKGGKTLNYIVIIYMPFYLKSVRNLYHQLVKDNDLNAYLNETQRIIYEKRDSPYFISIPKPQQ